MEPKINQKIREILEMFRVPTDKIIGEWNLIGHLREAFDILVCEEQYKKE